MTYSPFGIYRRPFLNARAVTPLRDGTGLRLVAEGRTLDLGVDGDGGGALALLEAMRDPRWEGWTGLRTDPPPDLAALLAALDLQGWLGEGDEGGFHAAEADRRLLMETAQEAEAWLAGAEDAFVRQAATGRPVDAYRQALASAAAEATRLWQDWLDHRRDARPLPAETPPGAPVQALALPLLLRAWQRTAPPALGIFAQAADGAARRLGLACGPVPPSPSDRIGEAAGGPGDAPAMRAQVWTACLLTLGSADGPPARFPAFCPERAEALPGIGALVAAEHAAEALLRDLGPPAVLAAIEAGGSTGRIAAGTYLHQHFVTIRYIEAVISFLRHRLREPLRGTGFAYLLEEIGHEAHEREACLHLGLDDADIDAFAPLPLFSAYPDILGYVAEIDPLAFCLAVMVAEGLPGSGKPVTRALERAGLEDPTLAAHGEIDLRLDHATYTRRLFRHLPLASGPARLRAIRHLLFLVELSQRAWTDLARYAADGTLPTVPVPFAMTPGQTLAAGLA